MKVFRPRTEIQGLNAWSVVFFIGIYFFLGCTEQPKVKGSLVPAAEFEQQESMLICWNPKFQDIILRLTTVIAKQDHVTLFYNKRNHKPEKLEILLEERKIKRNNVTLVPFSLEKDNIWIRDYGPTFMMDEYGNQEVLTFKYSHEENQEYNLFSDQYTSKMRLPLMRSKMFSSGGAREINGKGTIILVEGYEKYINPDLSLEEIENEYRQKLNQKNVIWLKRGIPQDDSFDNGPVIDNIYGNGVNWHLDEFCRFADAETILLAKVDSTDLERDTFYKLINERLEESYNILNQAKDQDGNPFKIIRVPQAPVIFNEGQYNGANIYYTPVTSYLNFVLTNHAVIVPSYYRIGEPDFIRDKDANAKKIFQEIFKDRKVFLSNAIDLNYSGGGLHCITIHKPKIKKRTNKFTSIFGKRG